ncbi:MAG: Uma2 family endonuclease [Elainella sp.]
MSQTLQQILPPLTLAKISLEQYHRMVEAGIWDDRQVELLNGIIVEMAPEGIPHASKRTKAQEYLVKLLGDTVQLRIAAPITLEDASEPEPDLAIVRRQDDQYDIHHPYPEDIFWVIEYSQTSLEKDLGIKAAIYAAAEIAEYWVVNLNENKLVILREPIDGLYQSRQELASGQISPVAFPGVAVEVARLLG